MGFEPDPDYDLVVYEKPKRGRQCGKCGMKFDYNTGYGFYCTQIECPMGMGPGGGQWISSEVS